MDSAHSPWWYRQRGPVIGAIYAGAFALGSIIWNLLGHPFEALYRWSGDLAGVSGMVTVAALAILCTAICFAIRAWGSSYLTAGTVWNADARLDKLIVAGPFRYTRNPLYLGNVFMGAGIGAFGAPPTVVLLVVGNIWFSWLLARHESGLLRQRYGDAFVAYAKNVPWLLPRLTPAAPVGEARPSLAQGLLAEIFSGTALIGMIVLCFVPPVDGPRIYIALLVLGWVVQQIIGRRLRPSSASPA